LGNPALSCASLVTARHTAVDVKKVNEIDTPVKVEMCKRAAAGSRQVSRGGGKPLSGRGEKLGSPVAPASLAITPRNLPGRQSLIAIWHNRERRGTALAVWKLRGTMLGRRMYQRHLMTDCNGTLYVSADIAVERRGDTELIATADQAHMPGEVLSIELVHNDARIYVRVKESRPILVDGKLRHRLRLTPIRRNRGVTTKEPDRPMADQRQRDATEFGALTRPLRVRMLNCSASGCLLESYVPVEMGTVAALEVSVSGQVFNDAAQVVRCHAIAGSAGIHRIAARLLSTTPPHHGSLRHAMRSVTSALETPLLLEALSQRLPT
jgi:hypothetical protein